METRVDGWWGNRQTDKRMRRLSWNQTTSERRATLSCHLMLCWVPAGRLQYSELYSGPSGVDTGRPGDRFARESRLPQHLLLKKISLQSRTTTLKACGFLTERSRWSARRLSLGTARTGLLFPNDPLGYCTAMYRFPHEAILLMWFNKFRSKFRNYHFLMQHSYVRVYVLRPELNKLWNCDREVLPPPERNERIT